MNREEYGRMRAVEDRHWWYGGLHALVIGALGRYARPGCVIADVGCGTGGMSARLEATHRVVGLDLSPEALAFCRERGLRRLSQADAGHLPLADGTADVALLLDVLYHRAVSDRGMVLAEARRILRPGGLVMVNVPAYRWLFSSHDVAVHTAHRFTRPEVNGLLEDAGFEMVSSSYWNSLLLPPIAVCRLARRGLPHRGSDLNPDTPAWINGLLGGLLALERRWMTLGALPAGLSIFVVARVPADRQ